MRGPISLCLALWVIGCGDKEPAVPFKRSESVAAKPAKTAKDEPFQVEASPHARQGVSLPPDSRSLSLSGRTLHVEEGALRAALEVELDGKPPGELLLVTQDAQDVLALATSAAAERIDAWDPPRPGAALGGARAGCTTEQVALKALRASYAIAELSVACAPAAEPAPPEAGGPAPSGAAQAAAPNTAPGASPPTTPSSSSTSPPSPQAPPPSPDPPQSPKPSSLPPPAPDEPTAAATAEALVRTRELWVISLESVPRVLEHIGLEDGGGGRRLDVALDARDADADGHDDLEVTLTLRSEGGGSAEPNVDRLPLMLLNRPSGLARDAEQPEATMLALANEAKQARKGKPEVARAKAGRALRLHAALCREAEHPLISFGGVAGVPCGASLGAGRALSVQVALTASAGRLFEALEGQRTLADKGVFRMTDNDRDRVRYAFDSLIQQEGIAWRRGPRVTQGAMPPLRRGALAFIDERRLLVRGPTSTSFDLAHTRLEPVGIPGDRVLTDPSGRYALVDILRSCDGFHLRIVDAAQVVAGVVLGKAVAEPLIEPAPPPAGTRCSELPAAARKSRGDYAVLDWTRDGVLLARRGALLLLPMTEQAQASAAAHAIGAKDALPAGHADSLTPDGRYRAIPTELGIAVEERATGKARLIALPKESAAVAVADVAISPSGQRVAAVIAGQVFVAEPAAVTSSTSQPPPSPDDG